MKKSLRSVSAIFILITFTAFAQTKITPSQAKDYIGKTVIVSGKVDQVTHSSTGTWFINMGGKYPNNSFTAVVFKSDADKFTNLKDLEGKAIEVKGKIKEYRGTPEIILDNSDQLKILTEE